MGSEMTRSPEEEMGLELPKDPKERAWMIARFMREYDQVAVNYEMDLLEVGPGYARIGMRVTAEMLNAVRLVHGGVTFCLADFAFAVAANSHGQVAVATSVSISYPAPAREGDYLVAEAQEVARTRRTGLYQIQVRREDGTLVALFTGNVFRRDDSVAEWMAKVIHK